MPMEIPFDEKAQLGYVWLIWGLNINAPPELIAISTTDEARNRYIEAGKQRGTYKVVRDEKAFVDHLYGNGMLTAMRRARR